MNDVRWWRRRRALAKWGKGGERGWKFFFFATLECATLVSPHKIRLLHKQRQYVYTLLPRWWWLVTPKALTHTHTHLMANNTTGRHRQALELIKEEDTESGTSM